MAVWMGVDLGDARVGIAVSDPEGSMAYPLRDITVYGDSFQALDECIEIIDDHHVNHVVVGYPLLLNGEEGKSARKDRRWAQQLRIRLVRRGISSVSVQLQDERLTTVTAHRQLEEAGYRARKHRPMVDQQSAVIILQTALDRFAHQEGR